MSQFTYRVAHFLPCFQHGRLQELAEWNRKLYSHKNLWMDDIINYYDLPLFWYYLQSNQIIKDYQSCPGTIISDSSSFPPSPSSLSKSSSLSSVCTHLWRMGGGGPRDTFCPKSSCESLSYFCSYHHLPSITHHPPTTMCSRSFNQPRLRCYRISHFNGCLFVLHWENHPWTISPGLWELVCVQKA